MKRECKWYPVCPMNYYHKAGKLDKKWIDNFCNGNWATCIRYQKAAAGIYHPDNMLPDGQIDKNLS